MQNGFTVSWVLLDSSESDLDGKDSRTRKVAFVGAHIPVAPLSCLLAHYAMSNKLLL
jgi:hypothetical protein